MHRDDLGEARRLSADPALCSRCGAVIPDEDVPLILFGDTRPNGDCDAWQFCDACAGHILEGLAHNGRSLGMRSPLVLVRPNQEPR